MGRRQTIEWLISLRTAYAQLAILALCAATLLDDGLFLVVVASMIAIALGLYGGRRLLQAARRDAAGRAKSVAAQTSLAPLLINQPAESADPGLGLATQD